MDSEVAIQSASGTNYSSWETDALLDSYRFHCDLERIHREEKLLLAGELSRRSPRTDDCKTTRIRGQKLRAKLEYPDDSWDQGLLKEAYHAFPALRDEFLSIGSLRVRLREYKKMLHEKGDPAYEKFKSMIGSANRGPQGAPRIILEE